MEGKHPNFVQWCEYIRFAVDEGQVLQGFRKGQGGRKKGKIGKEGKNRRRRLPEGHNGIKSHIKSVH